MHCQVIRTIKDELGMDIKPRGKGKSDKEGLKHPILLYSCLERPRFLKQLLGIVNGSNPDGTTMDKPWDTVQRVAAAVQEKKKMQKVIGAAGLSKIDPETKLNYWEEEMRKWVPDKVLGAELANAEVLTLLKEQGLDVFWDKEVFKALRVPNKDLESRALKKVKESMDPWITSLKVIAVASRLALMWLEENNLVVKKEGRKSGDAVEWKGPLKKVLAGKLGWWQYVLELVHGPYAEPNHHPFLWMAKLGKSLLFPRKLLAGEVHPLDGVWRRLFLG